MTNIVCSAGVGRLPELNTLILKQNQLEHLGDSLQGCTALAKLSVAHNRWALICACDIHCTQSFRVLQMGVCCYKGGKDRNKEEKLSALLPKLQLTSAGGMHGSEAVCRQALLQCEMPKAGQPVTSLCAIVVWD